MPKVYSVIESLSGCSDVLMTTADLKEALACQLEHLRENGSSFSRTELDELCPEKVEQDEDFIADPDADNVYYMIHGQKYECFIVENELET